MNRAERDRAIRELRVYLAENVAACIEYDADEDLAEYKARLSALDALIASDRLAKADARQLYSDMPDERASELNSYVPWRQLFDRCEQYARELAGEGVGDGE